MTQCISKKRYASEFDADRALETIRGNDDAWLNPKVPSRAYPCDVCRGWHLTAIRQWSDTRPRRKGRRGKR